MSVLQISVQDLNSRAAQLAAQAVEQQNFLRISCTKSADATLLDFGVSAEGGLAAGLLLARMCMADLADVHLAPADESLVAVPQIFVRTDHPLEACLMSQYAGWKVATEDYFAMASGPMRAAARKEALFSEFPVLPDEPAAVGVLEAASMPPEQAVELLREGTGRQRHLTLAGASTASQAGNIQVVARSVETALHKLHELNFPLAAVISGTGTAPLPPVAKNDLHGIGRTNDSILYGATVNLWVRCEDSQIETIGPSVPSASSASHGQTFLTLFKAAHNDFYALDPALFSPAVVVFHNLKTGRSFRYGHRMPELLRESFGMGSV